MKALVYVSADAVAYSEDSLNTILAGQGMPPTCPIWAETHVGYGLNPCQSRLVEVDEPADVYENVSGKWKAVKKNFTEFKNEKIRETKETQANFNRALMALKNPTK